MADVSPFGFESDSAFAHYLVKEVGVATVPGSSFYADPSKAPQMLRFCFSKRDETLHEADRRLARLSIASGERSLTCRAAASMGGHQRGQATISYNHTSPSFSSGRR